MEKNHMVYREAAYPKLVFKKSAPYARKWNCSMLTKFHRFQYCRVTQNFA